MERKPKPLFWVIVFIAVIGLSIYGLNRAGILTGGDQSGQPTTRVDSPRGSVEVLFYSSSAKRAWINEMVAEFNADSHRVGRKKIVVKAFFGTSGGMLDQLKEGKIKPDLWSPGDGSWLELGAAHWQTVYRTPLYDSVEPLVNIPLVITMWEQMARALGYPDKPLGWLDIAEVAAHPEGWAAYGHPEWGKFRWGHAHPDANSGFLSVISEVYAILGKTEGITAEDLKSPAVTEFLRQFEGAVEHYGLSNSWIDDLMRDKGPSYLSCAVQYENTIIQSNEKHKNSLRKLVAIYPKEGNFWTQHPAVVLNESWVTEEKREAAQAFVAFLLSRDAQKAAMKLGLRPIDPELELSRPFDEEHGVRIDIDASRAFEVPDEAVLKRIRDLWEEVKVPATVVLVLDRSSSMKGAPMDNAKRGAMEFIRSMKPRDQLKVVVFSQNIAEVVPLCEVRECGETAIAKVHGLFAEGTTALHDVTVKVYEDVHELQRTDPQRRYCIVLLSDGKDTASTMNKHDFVDTLPSGEDYDVPKIYAIAYGSDADEALLAEICNRTNARLFESSPEEILKTYKELSANF